jgi:hypothetical protein
VGVNVPGLAASDAIVTPTVAETGVPISGGQGGPGPSSGSLHDIRQPSLAAASSTRSSGPAKKYESAEEEKTRLQREERERLLHGQSAEQTPGDGATNKQDEPSADDGGETPPPYQDI